MQQTTRSELSASEHDHYAPSISRQFSIVDGALLLAGLLAFAFATFGEHAGNTASPPVLNASQLDQNTVEEFDRFRDWREAEYE